MRNELISTSARCLLISRRGARRCMFPVQMKLPLRTNATKQNDRLCALPILLYVLSNTSYFVQIYLLLHDIKDLNALFLKPLKTKVGLQGYDCVLKSMVAKITNELHARTFTILKLLMSK